MTELLSLSKLLRNRLGYNISGYITMIDIVTAFGVKMII